MELNEEELKKKVAEFREKNRELSEEISEKIPHHIQDLMDVNLEEDSLQVLSLKKSLTLEMKKLVTIIENHGWENPTDAFRKQIEDTIGALRNEYEVSFKAIGSKLPETFYDCMEDYDDLLLFVDRYGVREAIRRFRERSNNSDKKRYS